MATSATEISNLALALIGDMRIKDIDGTDERSQVCKLWYGKKRRELLSHPDVDWTFARVRAQLTAEATPAFGWGFSYAIPADYLRLRRHTSDVTYHASTLYYAKGDIPSYPYTIEGNSILTNKEECFILYIKDITDPTKFPPLFEAALYTSMATALATRLANDPKQQISLLEIYRNVTLPDAMAADGSENYEEEGYSRVACAGRFQSGRFL